jgi:hypothetical protein
MMLFWDLVGGRSVGIIVAGLVAMSGYGLPSGEEEKMLAATPGPVIAKGS